VPHRLSRRERGRLGRTARGADLELAPQEDSPARGERRVISLGAGTRLLVRAGPR